MQIRSFIINDFALCLIEGNDNRYTNRLDIVNATRRLFPVVCQEYFLSQSISSDVDVLAETLETIGTHVEGIYRREWYYALCAEIRTWLAARIDRWQRVNIKYSENIYSIFCYGDYHYELDYGRVVHTVREEIKPIAEECQFVTDPTFVADTLTPEASEDILEAYESDCRIEYTVENPRGSELPDRVLVLHNDEMEELFRMKHREEEIGVDSLIDSETRREIRRIRRYKTAPEAKKETVKAKHAKPPKHQLTGNLDYVQESMPHGPWAKREKVDMHKAVNRSRLDKLRGSLTIRQTCSFPK